MRVHLVSICIPVFNSEGFVSASGQSASGAVITYGVCDRL